MAIIEKIKKFFAKDEVELDYPRDFYIVDWSSIALGRGSTGNMNKIIYVYGVDEYGNRKRKKFFYSEERIFALENIHRIPGFDKTIKYPKTKFPVFSRILPMEATYSP